MLTIKNMGVIFITGLILLGVLIVSSGYYNNSNLNKAEEIWDKLKGEKSERAYILNAIYSGIGYGGMIHDFKNYIIRYKASKWNKVYVHFGKVRSLIARYQSLPLSLKEKELFKPVLVMLNDYEAAINRAAELREKGFELREIDTLIKVSDEPALEALKKLSALVFYEENHESKQLLLNNIKIEVGYGGMIHLFKNYILRANPKDRIGAIHHASNALRIIDQFRDLKITSREEINLSIITSMINSYTEMLIDISSMHHENATVSSIDGIMSYDDTAALNAFIILQNIIIRENSKSSQKLISSLGKAHQNTILTGYLSVFIIVSLILFLARNYYLRILMPISRITLNMKELASGQINESLPIPCSNDEISEMIESIEVFRQQAQSIQEAENRFETLFDASPFGVLAVSEDGEVIMANAKSADIFGYTQTELLNLSIDKLVPESFRQKHTALLVGFHKDATAHKMNGYREVYAAHKEGRTIPVEINLNPINLNGQKIVLCAISDISFRKEAEHELEKLSKSVERSPNLVLITDANGSIEYVNNSFTRVTGYTLKELLGKSPSVLSTGDAAQEDHEVLWETVLAGNEWRGKLLNKKKNNEVFWASHVVFPITNYKHEITNFVNLFEDISESKKALDELEYRAAHDLLTGLKNRHYFEIRLSSLMTQSLRSDRANLNGGAVCFIDLDQFKVINDTSGHVAGDELLRKVGQLLPKMVRKNDLVARFGGDEFVILMENCPAEKSIEIAEEIRSSVEKIGFTWQGVNYSTSCSIGIVQYDQNDSSLTEIMKRADGACYAAKDNGRNTVYAAFEMDEAIANRQNEMHWLSDIVAGLADNRFELYAQLIAPVNCCGKNGEEYEILIRYRNEKGEIIPPGAFLPAAERYQQAEKIDSWVINELFRWISENRAELSHIGSFAVNLSGQSLGSKDILRTITNGLQHFVIPPSLIKFEVTETAAITNLTQAIEFIEAVKSYGCSFSLDDFGSGLSSFAYLKILPVDILKIDGMFVKNILEDKVDFAMVKMINEIGHTMGMKTIAEFVENDEILAKIKEIGVNYAQGYGIAKPLPIEEIKKTCDKPLLPSTGGHNGESITIN